MSSNTEREQKAEEERLRAQNEDVIEQAVPTDAWAAEEEIIARAEHLQVGDDLNLHAELRPPDTPSATRKQPARKGRGKNRNNARLGLIPVPDEAPAATPPATRSQTVASAARVSTPPPGIKHTAPMQRASSMPPPPSKSPKQDRPGDPVESAEDWAEVLSLSEHPPSVPDRDDPSYGLRDAPVSVSSLQTEDIKKELDEVKAVVGDLKKEISAMPDRLIASVQQTVQADNARFQSDILRRLRETERERPRSSSRPAQPAPRLEHGTSASHTLPFVGQAPTAKQEGKGRSFDELLAEKSKRVRY